MKNFRTYGDLPYSVVLVHGGPGAPGEMAPIAQELSGQFGVLEALQTRNTLEGQLEELKQVIESQVGRPVILMGHSYGAWLSLILAAAYPNLVSKLILVSAGAFKDEYAQNIIKTRLDRLEGDDMATALMLMAGLNEFDTPNKNEVFGKLGELISKSDAFDPIPHEPQVIEYSYGIYKNVWSDAAELRTSGDLLKLAGVIKCPVVAIHGGHDPHLAEGVREPLNGLVPDLKFILLQNCGHYPWWEKQAREQFFTLLRQELIQ